MITKEALTKILQSYNINSTKYGPTIYNDNSELGICLEIKDSLFGFLTRAFIFNNEEEAHNFLKQHLWFKNNKNKYPVEIKLNDYQTKTPLLNYTIDEETLNLEKMLNIENLIKENIEEKKFEEEKNIYIIIIEKLINYLKDFKIMKDNIKIKKNNLKTEENNLKYELLESLTIYYGKERKLEKKPITLEIIDKNDNISKLIEEKNNIIDKDITTIKDFLTTLINVIKEEELDEKNFINIYSNTVYEYNIEILNKQIAFVKNKIEAEKNFNVKGSNIHNIDAELKSFLKTNIAPVKIETFLAENKEQINNKYKKIIDLKDAYKIISGNEIELPKIKIETKKNKKDVIKDLKFKFDNLEPKIKESLVLYNSFYKDICNYIINNIYPPIEDIIKKFDFNYYYNELEEIVYHENNSHYLISYFNQINFKNLEKYINSIIEICHTIENTSFKLLNNIKVFGFNNNSNKYKSLSINPIFNEKENVYLIDLEKDSNVLYIPDKLEIDELNKEISTIITENIYIKGELDLTDEEIILTKYTKKQETKNDLTITTNLNKKKEMKFTIGKIKGE